MNDFPTSDRAHGVPAGSFYGAAVLLSSLGIAYWLVDHGCDAFAAAAIPLIGTTVLFRGAKLLVVLLPAALIFALAFGHVEFDRGVGGSVVILFACLFLLSCAARWSMCVARDPWSGARLPSDAPSARSSAPRGNFPFHAIQMIGLVWLVIALVASLVLTRPMYDGLRRGPHVGLLPEAYFMVATTLVLAVCVGLGRGLVHYIALGQGRSRLGDLWLRSEIWHWQGAEERRIARARKRYKKT